MFLSAEPVAELRRAAQRVAVRENLPQDWLNDAVKGFFSATGRFEIFREMSHLRVFVPNPEYQLAMKCLATRLGEEFQDRHDIAVLLKALALRTSVQAEEVLSRYYSLEKHPVRARYVLEEMLQGDRPQAVASISPFAPKPLRNTASAPVDSGARD